ncbi:MAG: hypothetical protein M1815_001340 [Lichina confinis]|nr:MAG: hypothetical protein M1815_001340 [Lichina confinis]
METPRYLQQSVEASKAEYRRLGASGLKVSVPIVGAMSYGDPTWARWVLNEEEATAALKLAPLGTSVDPSQWDTANIYSNGSSEKVIAKAIKQYDIPREKVVILTKCYGPVADDPSLLALTYPELVAKSKDFVNQSGLSRAAIFNAVEASLKRLDMEYIDLLQIHRFDKNTPIEETMEALHDLVKSGKVRYIGASSMWTYQFVMMQALAEKRGWTKFVSMQNHYNLLYREEEREMNKYCKETGVGLIPWAPLCRGHLARPLEDFGNTVRSASERERGSFTTGTTETDKKIIKRVQNLAARKGWTMSTVALAWINKRVTSPLIGFSSLERIDGALEARGKMLTDEEEKHLEELYQPRPIQGHS